MRVLTLKQPWASLVMVRLKDEEFRTHRLKPGPLLIHAGKSKRPLEECLAEIIRLHTKKYAGLAMERPLDLDRLRAWYDALPQGVILGQVEVGECYRIEEGHPMMTWGHLAHPLRVVSVWEIPQPAQGKLGIWKWEPTDSLFAGQSTRT